MRFQTPLFTPTVILYGFCVSIAGCFRVRIMGSPNGMLVESDTVGVSEYQTGTRRLHTGMLYCLFWLCAVRNSRTHTERAGCSLLRSTVSSLKLEVSDE
jgi:hypothetical protein